MNQEAQGSKEVIPAKSADLSDEDLDAVVGGRFGQYYGGGWGTDEAWGYEDWMDVPGLYE
jgi:hypothetical protein